MSEGKHTAWAVWGEDEANGVPFIEIGQGEMGHAGCRSVCEVTCTLTDDDDFVITSEDWDRARLIAASPVMLEALKEGRTYMNAILAGTKMPPRRGMAVLEAMNTAIAAAIQSATPGEE